LNPSDNPSLTSQADGFKRSSDEQDIFKLHEITNQQQISNSMLQRVAGREKKEKANAFNSLLLTFIISATKCLKR
jgi:hypothetical protein